MVLFKLFLFLILKGTLAENNETERRGVQLWRAQGDLDEDVIEEFYDRAHFTEDIWKRDNRTIDFLIYNDEKEELVDFFKEHNVTVTVLIEDVRTTVDEALVNTFPVRRNGDPFDWKRYPNVNQIFGFLQKMASTYPTRCSLVTLGKTTRFKPIYLLKISNGNRNNKPTLVESGIHGREWTGVVSTLYFIDSIVKNFDTQPEYVKKRDWHIIPVLNPDGYEYSLSTDRLWKKNRHKLSGSCSGIDLNRNFDYNWGKLETTMVPCSDNYCGPQPFSEPETQAFKSLADGTHFYGYLSIHSAGSKVLFPVGAEHDDHKKHLEFTKQMALAMRKVGKSHFVNGDIQKMGKRCYGMAIDWMYFVKEVKHAYIIETRGQNGLDLIPPNQILIAAKEVRAGILKFAEIYR